MSEWEPEKTEWTVAEVAAVDELLSAWDMPELVMRRVEYLEKEIERLNDKVIYLKTENQIMREAIKETVNDPQMRESTRTYLLNAIGEINEKVEAAEKGEKE